MIYRYVPMLRAKAGEATALMNLTATAKDRMFPILHLASEVPGNFAARVGAAWSGRALGLDGWFNFNETGSGTAMQNAFAGLTGNGVTIVPSVEYGAPQGYLNVVGPLAQAGNTGLVVKARLGQLSQVAGWLTAGGWQLANVDLVVLAGHIADFGAGVLNPVVQHSLATLPQGWRSVTLAGSAAPKDMGSMGRGANVVPRLDWQLWQAMSPLTPYRLDYGDFGISHPDMTEPPGYVMGSATVSVRYTLDNDWVVLKGRQVSGPNGLPMGAQYTGHAQQLVGNAAFGGLVGCWGDARIQQIVSGAGSPGSRQTWVEIGANRHLSLVANRLP